jgi:hypothetical protein
MKKIFLILSFIFFMPSLCLAEKYYVCVAKQSSSSKATLKTRINKGDIKYVERYTVGHKPTRAEKDRCDFLVVDMNPEDLILLFDPMYLEERTKSMLLRKRRRSVDIESITKEELTRDEFMQKIIDHSRPVINNR